MNSMRGELWPINPRIPRLKMSVVGSIERVMVEIGYSTEEVRVKTFRSVLPPKFSRFLQAEPERGDLRMARNPGTF